MVLTVPYSLSVWHLEPIWLVMGTDAHLHGAAA